MSTDKPIAEFFPLPLSSGFRIGDKVIDLTAQKNGWEDLYGKVVQVDGSNIKVRYKSGNERWKIHINLERIAKIP